MGKVFALLALILVSIVGIGLYIVYADLNQTVRGPDPAVSSAALEIEQSRTPLRPEATPALSAWLAGHADGWGRFSATPPLCDRWITLTYPDGRTVALAVYSNSIIAHGAWQKGLIAKGVSASEIDGLISFFSAQ